MVQMAGSWELTFAQVSNWLLVSARPVTKDGGIAQSLLPALWSTMQRHRTYRMVLDLWECRVMGNPLIGEVGELDQRARALGGCLRMCGLSPRDRESLRDCGLGHIYDLYAVCQDEFELPALGSADR
jgi:anti-anti-sigma regulatory factor